MKQVKLILSAMVMVAMLGVASHADGMDDKAKTHIVKAERISSSQTRALIRVIALQETKSAVLTVKDKDGIVLYREYLGSARQYAKKYDFSGMPDGKYAVEVSTKIGSVADTFEVGAAAPAIVAPEKTLAMKPVVQVDRDLVKVLFMNKNDESLALRLYDAAGNTLYEAEVGSAEKFAKGLDMSYMGKGKYSLAIVGEGVSYSKAIETK